MVEDRATRELKSFSLSDPVQLGTHSLQSIFDEVCVAPRPESEVAIHAEMAAGSDEGALIGKATWVVWSACSAIHP